MNVKEFSRWRKSFGLNPEFRIWTSLSNYSTRLSRRKYKSACPWRSPSIRGSILPSSPASKEFQSWNFSRKPVQPYFSQGLTERHRDKLQKQNAGVAKGREGIKQCFFLIALFLALSLLCFALFLSTHLLHPLACLDQPASSLVHIEPNTDLRTCTTLPPPPIADHSQTSILEPPLGKCLRV